MDPRAGWAQQRRLQILPSISPGAIKLISSTSDVRTYSDACAPDGGVEAVASFKQNFAAPFCGRRPRSADRITGCNQLIASLAQPTGCTAWNYSPWLQLRRRQ